MKMSFSTGQRYALLAGILTLLVWTGCKTMEESPPDSMPSYDIEALERSIHRQVNEERRANGRELLKWSDDLARVSRAHSQDMVERDFYAHVNPDDQSPTERGEEVGVSCSTVVDNPQTGGIAENINWVSALDVVHTTRSGEEKYEWYTADEIADEVVQEWMRSPGHRRNMLHESNQAEGIGVAMKRSGEFEESGDFRVLVTQTFC
ncbi:hypothetical protein CRI93_13115 [Longimonas halophila]|uniref:SCP domain-containing protein n=2 Tax=Longimonas halophila TaxID=1469170 RepID=A0A2H3P2N9_9BACT|nr:hypothetical protein CRI93_13115 [Longimonas halophila]